MPLLFDSGSKCVFYPSDIESANSFLLDCPSVTCVSFMRCCRIRLDITFCFCAISLFCITKTLILLTTCNWRWCKLECCIVEFLQTTVLPYRYKCLKGDCSLTNHSHIWLRIVTERIHTWSWLPSYRACFCSQHIAAMMICFRFAVVL